VHLNRVNPLTNIGQRSPSSAKATVAQIEMSSTLLTRTSRGKGPATADDAEDAASPAPTPARNKSGRFVRQQPTEEIDESGTAVPTIPSGSRVIDEDTPVDSTVEDANDQLGGEGIRNPSNRPAFQGNHELSENLEAARREIAALRAANQELRHSIAPRKKENPKPRHRNRRHSNPRDRRNHSSCTTNSHASSQNGNQYSRHSDRQGGRLPHRPSDDPSTSGESDRNDSRSDGLSRSPRRSHKLGDPDPLDTGDNPTYKQWRDLIDGKMYGNRDWWETEPERMFYVFSMTKGKARDYLHARWGKDSHDPFLDTADMFDFLKQNFTNPNEVREAKDAYAELRQGSTPFPEFRAQFLMLAMQGHIPRSEFKDDLFRKLNPRIRELLSGVATDLTYDQLCVRALSVDNEVRINQKLLAAKRAARALPTAAQSYGQGQRTYAQSPESHPIRQSLPPVPERPRRSATAPPDRQRPSTAEEVDTCHNCGKPGHWAKECRDLPRPRIQEINELYPRVMEVDTDDEKSGAESQPENGNA
jgi:hypothetical protein